MTKQSIEGMTVNERLSHVGLFASFELAVSRETLLRLLGCSFKPSSHKGKQGKQPVPCGLIRSAMASDPRAIQRPTVLPSTVTPNPSLHTDPRRLASPAFARG